MKNLIWVMMIALFASSAADAQVFCIPDTGITYPGFYAAMGYGATFLATYDVLGFRPTNVRFDPVDSLSRSVASGFNKYVSQAIERLIYLKDTTDFKLTIKFLSRPLGDLDRSYAEKGGEEELDIVAPQKYIHAIADPMSIPNPSLTSDTIDATVPYKSGVAHASNILVERLFNPLGPYVHIISNNYPNLEDDITTVAKKYTKRDFLICAPNATRFFIRFKVVRELTQCNCTQTF